MNSTAGMRVCPTCEGQRLLPAKAATCGVKACPTCRGAGEVPDTLPTTTLNGSACGVQVVYVLHASPSDATFSGRVLTPQEIRVLRGGNKLPARAADIAPPQPEPFRDRGRVAGRGRRR